MRKARLSLLAVVLAAVPGCRPKEAAPDPRQLLDDMRSPDRELSGRARLQLITLGEPAVPALAEMLRSAAPEERLAAANTHWGMGERGRAAGGAGPAGQRGVVQPVPHLGGCVSDLVIVVTKVASAIPGLSQALGLLSAYFVATRIGLVASFASTLLGLGKAATATKTAVLGLTAAWGAYNTTQTTGAAISAANLVQMKLAFARMKAMQGVTQSAVGPPPP